MCVKSVFEFLMHVMQGTIDKIALCALDRMTYYGCNLLHQAQEEPRIMAFLSYTMKPDFWVWSCLPTF